jgi:hypothetical protein
VGAFSSECGATGYGVGRAGVRSAALLNAWTERHVADHAALALGAPQVQHRKLVYHAHSAARSGRCGHVRRRADPCGFVCRCALGLVPPCVCCPCRSTARRTAATPCESAATPSAIGLVARTGHTGRIVAGVISPGRFVRHVAPSTWRRREWSRLCAHEPRRPKWHVE